MKKNHFLGVAAFATLTAAFILYFLRRRKLPTQLIIIGNGFDIHHGIPSQYLQFREYLRQKDDTVFDIMEKYLYLQGDDEWKDLENNLANLDADELLDEMSIFLGDPSSDDWKDSMYHDFQYEVGQVTDNLGEKMKQHFLNWILQLDIRHKSLDSKLSLPLDGLFLNFNYTDSLEKIYCIPAKNIYYIHGKAVSPSSEIVLGHGWENYTQATQAPPFTLQDALEGDFPATEEDWQYSEAKQYIQNYFASTYKNAKQIIQSNKGFFRSLKGIKEIYVMGHSMSRVDGDYFKAIASHVNIANVKWTVSYYYNSDIENAIQTLTNAGVNMNLVTFNRLRDFFSTQLDLF